jgi:hypothetical protein
MRVFISAFVTATTLLVTACSGGTEDTTLQRGRSASASRSPGATSATGATGGGSSNAASGPSSPAAPAPPVAATPPATGDADASTGPASGSTPAPAPAPAAAPLGSCGNPKCAGGNGLAGCKATDSAGDLVTMGCQNGVCGCFAGGQNTAGFDGDVNSADDAAQLFLANCPCN